MYDKLQVTYIVPRVNFGHGVLRVLLEITLGGYYITITISKNKHCSNYTDSSLFLKRDLTWSSMKVC